MIFEIPTDATAADFRISTQLDGSTYLLDLTWVSRADAWFLWLYLQTDTTPVPIVQGQRLSCGYPLLIGVTAAGRPPGELFALDLNGQGDAGRDDLGGRVKLFYFDTDALSG